MVVNAEIAECASNPSGKYLLLIRLPQATGADMLGADINFQSIPNF